MPATLIPLLQAAFDARASLLDALHAEHTTAYRLFTAAWKAKRG